MRKCLFCLVKQKATQIGYMHYWTANENIFVRKSDKSNPITVKYDMVLNLMK